MLCPQCRRQVGRDGYCPQGHLAAPERAAPQEPVFYPPAPSAATAAPPVPGAPPIPGAPPPVPPEGGLAAPKAPRRPMVVAIAFLLLVVAALGFMAFGRSASAANLKYVFANGEKHKYLLDIDFNVSAGNLAFGGIAMKGRMEMLMSQTTTSVKDGVATITYAVEKILVTEGRTRANIPIPETALTVRMRPDGTVLDADGSGLLELGSDDPVSNLTGMIGPESFGPVLPDHKVDPGQSWEISERMANPFGEAIDFRGTGQLLERRTVGGQEIAVIKSDTNTPFNFDISFDDLAEFAGEANTLGNGRMTFDGFFSTNLTQSFATKSGFLQSVLGDVKLTGTLTIEGVPQLGPGQNSAVMNILMNITMTEVP